MQTSVPQSAQSTSEEVTRVKPQQPTEIDSRLLTQISGGAPKGGWNAAATASLGNTEAPKGGW
jgi:hypothetical protein